MVDCGRCQHEVRNSIIAVAYYNRLVMDEAERLGLADFMAHKPKLAEALARLENALTACREQQT